MIGNFARILRGSPRPVDIEKELAEAKGEPPERFVEKISDEGGDVYVAPVLETLRAAVKRHLHPSAAGPDAGTPDEPAPRE